MNDCKERYREETGKGIFRGDRFDEGYVQWLEKKVAATEAILSEKERTFITELLDNHFYNDQYFTVKFDNKDLVSLGDKIGIYVGGKVREKI